MGTPSPSHNAGRTQKRLSQAELRVQARELDKLTRTTNFEAFFRNNKKQYVPNLKLARSRSSSRESLIDGDTTLNSTSQDNGFIKPRKVRKLTSPTDKVDISLNNRYSSLEDMNVDGADDQLFKRKLTQKNDISDAHTTSQNKGEILTEKLKSRAPPIHVYNVQIKDTVKVCVDAGINVNDFWVKRTREDYVIITPNSFEVHSTIKKVLISNQQKFYTYTPREQKTKTLVLKGISSEFNEDDVKDHIQKLNLTDVKVDNVTKLHFDKKNHDRFFFLVHLSADSISIPLTKIKYILQQPIRWERIKKKKIFQCKRCQRIGHASKNCNLEFRCVKCGGNHGPIKEGNNCPVTKDNSKETLKCANCGEYGHPASYGGCAYLTAAHDIKKKAKEIKRSLRENSTSIIRDKVNYNNYFSATLDNYPQDFPSLPRRNAPTKTARTEELFPQDERTTTPAPVNNRHGNTWSKVASSNVNINNLSQMESILNSFQQNMMSMLKTHLQEINKKVEENTRNIEFLLSQFDY